MSGRQQLTPAVAGETVEEGAHLLRQLVQAPVQQPQLASSSLPSVVVGELVAIADDGVTPLVVHSLVAGTRALRARSVLDLHGAHVGRQVVLAFEHGDPERPIVMGVLNQAGLTTEQQQATQALAVESDGQRMVVSAQEQLVLRCGKASITLTRAGKLLIEGSYVLSRSTGVNRIKGGSVQLN